MAKKHTSNDDEEKIVKENIQKRFSNMFTGKHQPLSNMSIQEVEALKTRVSELEMKLAQQPPATDQTPATHAKEIVVQAETSKASHKSIKNSTLSEDRQRQLALGTAGILIVVSLVFLAFCLYTLFVTQGGKSDIADLVLIPFASLMVIVSLIGFRFIRRGQLALGAWMLYGINIIFASALTAFLVAGIYVLVTSYLAVFALIFINLGIPKTSKRKAIVGAAVAALTILGIEIWNPPFRVHINDLGTLIPLVSALAVLAVCAVIVRQTIAGSIRAKLISTFAVVAVLSMAFVAFLADRSLHKSLTADIVESQVFLASSQGYQVGQAIIGQFDKLKALATVKTLQVGAETASLEETRPADTAEIEKLNLAWRATVAAKNMNDPMVIALLYNPLSTQLRNFQKTFPENVEVLLTDQKGFSIASTNVPSNYYQADTLWWRTAHTTGQYIGQPIFNPATNSIALDVAVPVFSYRNDEFMGVLRATVNFDVLTELLLQGSRGQTGYSIIYQPNDQVIKLESEGNGKYGIIQDFASSSLQEFAASPNSSTELTLEGIPILISSAPVKPYSSTLLEEGASAVDDLNWRVLVVQEKAEALQSINMQTRNNLILTLLISLLVIGIAYFLAQFITNPIVHLNAIALQVASGDLSAEAAVETNDEIGTLAATFNKMTAQLRNLFTSLEQRVEDRTHDLELAAEVGRTITEKVADASEMLSVAAEMIRGRFELYYTQVYLIDTIGRKLVLRAGTGTAGEELLRRGHQLAIDDSSLNGQAVLQKKPILVADTQQSLNFRPNPLLPKTRSEMAVPLIADNEVIGVLDMQSEQPGALSENNLPAFEALAGQLAIALRNAALFTEAQEARSEAESHMRRFTEQGWQDFLDAIHHGHKIGFAFDESKVIRLRSEALSPKPDGIQLPISMAGTKLGEIRLPVEAEQTLSDSDRELIQTTSAQLAQHVENLRLLAQAERYRAEAEQAVRRLTHEGWESFLQVYGTKEPGYIYDLTEVKPLAEKNNGSSGQTIKHPMLLGDEVIGELAVDIPDQSEEAAEVLAAVAEQLSGHIENLRLSELNQRRAQREQILRQITSSLRSSNNPATIMRTAVRELGSIMGRRTVVQLATPQRVNETEPSASNENRSDAPASQS